MNNIVIPSGCSKIQLLWLEEVMRKEGIDIQHALSPDGEYHIKGVGYVDGYCASTNTVYEFHGSYWHGDPRYFNHEAINTVCKKSFGELYANTIKRDAAIRAMGYTLITVWESEVNRKALEWLYPQLVEKYGKKPIRIASKPRVLQPTIEERLRDERHQELIDSIKELKCREIELVKKAQSLRDELESLEQQRQETAAKREQVEHQLVIVYTVSKITSAIERLSIKEEPEESRDHKHCTMFLSACYTIYPPDFEFRDHARVKATDIRERYLKWCDETTVCSPIGRTSFYRVLDEILGPRLRHSTHKYVGLKPK